MHTSMHPRTRITGKIHFIIKLHFKYRILSVNSFPPVRNACYFHGRCNAQKTTILPIYYVSPRKLCWTRSDESTNRNASRIIGRCNMDCRCEKTWQRQAATAYLQRYKITSLLRNLAGRNEKYSWDSSQIRNSGRICSSDGIMQRESKNYLETFFNHCLIFLLVSRCTFLYTQLWNGVQALASPALHRAFRKSNSKYSHNRHTRRSGRRGRRNSRTLNSNRGNVACLISEQIKCRDGHIRHSPCN